MFLQIYKMLSNFDSNPLIFDPNLLPGKNSPNIAKSNHVFLGKGTGDRALILTYLDSPMAEVFPYYCLNFSISAIFRGKTCCQSWTKSSNFGPVSFLWIPQLLFKQWFFLPEYYLWWEFRQYWTIFGRLRAQKPPKKDHFMDAKSVRKTLKSFNLTTSNAVMMKLTTVMYLHESVKRKPLRAKNSIFGVMSTNFQTKLKTATNVCITLHCITGKIFVQIPWKTTQNRSKIIATITFKGL